MLTAVASVDSVAVDNQSFRLKADRFISRSDSGKFYKRVKCDLQHFCLEKLPESFHRSCVGIGKHICGAATDFAIRSMLRLPNESIFGLCIATCCHHRCDWEFQISMKKLYVSNHSLLDPSYFISHGFQKLDFNYICRISAWATLGDPEHEAVETNTDDNLFGLSQSKKAELGYKCKALIDYSRVQFLNDNGFKSRFASSFLLALCSDWLDISTKTLHEKILYYFALGRFL